MTGYAGKRRQVGKPIGDYQMVQQMLAGSAIDLTTTWLPVHRAAGMMDAGEDLRTHLSMVKVASSETLGLVVTDDLLTNDRS